jgi:hypothetical protein
MSFLSALNPLNWGKDISKVFLKNFENALYYFLSLFLNELLAAFSSLFGLFDASIEGIISGIVYTVSFLGPAAMPIFIVLLVAIFSGLILLIGLVKDVPVVGAIV